MKKLWNRYLIEMYYSQIEKRQDKTGLWKLNWLLIIVAFQTFFSIAVLLIMNVFFNLIVFLRDKIIPNTDFMVKIYAIPLFLFLCFFITGYIFFIKKKKYLILLQKINRPKNYFLYYYFSFGVVLLFFVSVMLNV